MSYQVLARKWRPTTFRQMVGQEHVLQALVNALDANRLHHAYLFTGTRGVGKTTVARIFAKALNCEQGIGSEPCGSCAICTEIDEGRSVDLLEIDAASRTGVDDMRELLDNVQYAPTRGRFKIYLIDEVHMLSKHSFNALLKTLEEPPPHVKFLLATTDPQKVPVTVLSRCLQFNLKRMSRSQIQGQLQYLVEQEQVEADGTALGQLAAAADGSMRDALSLLDQTIGYGGGVVRQEAVESMLGTISRDYLLQLFSALEAQASADLVRAARSVMERNPDYQRVCAEMIELLQRIALYQSDPRLVDADEYPEGLLQHYAEAWSAEEIQLYYQILLQGRQDLLICPDQASGFEMLMLRLAAFAPEAPQAEPQTLKKKPETHTRLMAATPAEETAARNSAPAPAAAPSAAVPAETFEPGPSCTDSTLAAVGERIDWSRLAYQLGLGGLAREIAVNSTLEPGDENRFTLTLPAGMRDLSDATIETEIREALEGKLGLSLAIELKAVDSPSGETPRQALVRQQENDRRSAIEAIRKDESVLKLKRAFDAELDETSVERIESVIEREVN